MNLPICTSDTWGDVTFINGALDGIVFCLACNLPHYRAAEVLKSEPVKKVPQMMICDRANVCENKLCLSRVPHDWMSDCDHAGCHSFATSRCIPVPSPAPVREIDREELQKRIDHVRAYLYCAQTGKRDSPLASAPAYGLGLLTDLEALADGKARVRGRELVSGASTVIFASQEAFEEAASEWARNENWKEPR